MKALLFSLCCATTLAAQHQPGGSDAESQAARAPLEHYLKGHATGDGAHMLAAFHPDAKVFWYRDGKLNQVTSTEFAARFTGKPAEDEAQRKRWIERVTGRWRVENHQQDLLRRAKAGQAVTAPRALTG